MIYANSLKFKQSSSSRLLSGSKIEKEYYLPLFLRYSWTIHARNLSLRYRGFCKSWEDSLEEDCWGFWSFYKRLVLKDVFSFERSPDYLKFSYSFCLNKIDWVTSDITCLFKLYLKILAWNPFGNPMERNLQKGQKNK